MTANLALPPFPSDAEPDLIADWAELSAMAETRPLSRGTLKTTLARAGQQNDTITADAWSEIERRSKLFKAEWPLKVENDVLVANDGAPTRLLNYFMCALTLGTDIDLQGRAIFEWCVRDVLGGLTCGNPAVRLGHPRHPPAPLNVCVQKYCSAGVEKIGDPLPSTDKDFGLDVVGWIPFPDGRGSYVHFVGQCATGYNWEDKLTELSVEQWREHVRWAIAPVRFFAAPFVIASSEFRRASQAAGLILDRPRLLHLSTKSPLSAETAEAVRKYCEGLYA